MNRAELILRFAIIQCEYQAWILARAARRRNSKRITLRTHRMGVARA